jgi:hypothetical protein
MVLPGSNNKCINNVHALCTQYRFTYFLARADDVPTVAIKLLEPKNVKSRVAFEWQFHVWCRTTLIPCIEFTTQEITYTHPVWFAGLRTSIKSPETQIAFHIASTKLLAKSVKMYSTLKGLR